MNHPLYVLGIDGGATKTTAILCALDGVILSEAQGGPTNFHIIGIRQTATTILDLIETCCHSVGCNVSEIGAIIAGLSGAGRLSDQQRIHDGIIELAQKRNLPLNTIAVVGDARIALEGALDGKPGIIVIAGTGSIVFGKDERGNTYRAGGWGREIGDEGSGYSLGREAFRVVARVFDGYHEKTKLVKLFEDKFGFSTPEQIIDALYQQNFDIASVVPTVIEAATEGDRAAKKIVRQACTELVEVISTVAEKMKKRKKSNGKQPLAFVGSLLTNDSIYTRQLRSALKRKVPQVSVRPAKSSPVVGAALMAIAMMKNQTANVTN